MMKKLYIYGNGGEGKKVAMLAKHLCGENRRYSQICFISDDKLEDDTFEIPVYTFEDVKNMPDIDTAEFIAAVGEPAVREKLYQRIIDNGFTVAQVIVYRQFEYSTEVSIGDGSVVHQNALVQPEVVIGKNCLINMGAILGHNDIIGDHSVVSSGVIIGGNTHIGNNTYIGSGAVIRDGIKIGRNCIVGMGAVVTKDVEDDAVVVGNPAKILRKNTTKKVFKGHN